MDEAIDWLRDGGDIQIFCEAIPWPEEPPPGNLQAHHKKGRSFAARSGTLPVRVVVTLVASFQGPCPHLQADMRCGAYEKRPRVCRIYPAEVNPFIRLDPASKACPPEAWSADKTVLMRGDFVADPVLERCIARSREADRHDVDAKERLCVTLGIDTAALANEGFLIYSPRKDVMLDALNAALSSMAVGHAHDDSAGQWRFMTNRAATRTVLDEIGALVVPAADAMADGPEYLAFHAAD